MATLIVSLNHLKRVSKEPVDVYITLNGGGRSSKTITYKEKENEFNIHNDIDDSFQTVPEDKLEEETNIVEAIEKSALYLY